MPDTSVPTPDGEDVSALANSLVRISRRLADVLPTIDDDAAREQLAASLESVRGISRSLRTAALLYEPEHARLFVRHGEGLRRLVEAMADLAADLSEANQQAATRLHAHAEALERVAELPQDEVADRLEATVAEARAMAAEMFDRFQGITSKVARAVESVEAMERELRETREKALLDAVTRLHSRLAFDERLEQAVAEGGTGQPWCLALLRVDSLADVVEQHGEVVGDALLYQVARAIEAALGGEESEGFLARYAAEEFALLLPGSELAEGKATGEAIRAGVAGRTWQERDRSGTGLVRATVGLGLTAFREGDSVAAVLGRALDALRQARAGGGNAVVAV
jgi:diguanylate cyclase